MPKDNSKRLPGPRDDWHRAPRNPLVDEPFGLRLKDVPKIRRGFSIWAIDDSGTPFITKGASDYFSLVGATVLDNSNLEIVLSSVTQYNGEFSFSDLRKEHPNECLAVMNDLGRIPILGICAPRYKSYREHVTAERVFRNRVIQIRDAIRQIDKSEHIIILVDKNNYLRFEDYIDLSVHNVIVSEKNSCDDRLVQLADAIVSSLGHALLPDGIGTDIYFNEIKRRCVNLSEGGGTCTQQNPVTLDKHTSRRKDKKDSKKKKSPKSNSIKQANNSGFLGRVRRFTWRRQRCGHIHSSRSLKEESRNDLHEPCRRETPPIGDPRILRRQRDPLLQNDELVLLQGPWAGIPCLQPFGRSIQQGRHRS